MRSIGALLSHVLQLLQSSLTQNRPSPFFCSATPQIPLGKAKQQCQQLTLL
ncbi:hypothetical protein ccbrp13_12750 [Ktedonobacteria bacterium brp13]|nr:hypothetical protein ccbrp13_12750 [Ktedonobacteria bacterium brp13]